MDKQIYFANVEALIKTQPSIVKTLEQVDLDRQDECEVFDGENGCKVLKVKKADGNYILYNSFYEPYQEAREITSHLEYGINRGLIIAVGVGLGYHLKEIIQNLNEKSKIIAVEKSPNILKMLLTYNDLAEAISKGKIFFVLDDADEQRFRLELGQWLRLLLKNMLFTQPQTLPIIDLDYFRFCKKVFSYIMDMKLTFFFSLGNSLDDTVMGIDNRLKNIAHIIKNPGINQLIEQYGDVYKGKPAIIIASGPSLNKNVHLLKEAQGKALLLACDGSLETLKKHGIVPDVVSSVERILLTYQAFYKDKEIPGDTVLAAPAVVRPEIFETFKNKTLSMFKSEPLGRIFNQIAGDKGAVWSGASVAHLLMGIAHKLGASPIVLVGQDLAYSPEGVSHAAEVSIKEEVDLNKADLFVKDIYGNDIATSPVWHRFLVIFEEYLRSFDINCIDATEGGARINGTKISTLREVIDTYCTQEIRKLRELVDSLQVTEDESQRLYYHAFKGLRKFARRFYLFVRRTQKGLELNNQAKQMIEAGITTDEELDQVYDAMDYTEHKVVRKLGKYSDLMMFFQYPVMQCVDKVNELGSEVTLDVLSQNLDIQKQLLTVMKQYCRKTVMMTKSGFEMLKEQACKEFSEKPMLQDFKFPDWKL